MKHPLGRLIPVLMLCAAATAALGQTSPEEYIKAGEERHRRGEYDSAIAMYNLAITADPTNPVAYGNRGAAKHAKRDYKGAIEDYSKALEIEPKFLNAVLNRGRARLELPDTDGAIADFSKLIEAEPKFAPAYNFRASAREQKGDTAGALADIDKAIELDPRSLEAYVNRGTLKRSQGKGKEAVADYTRAIEIDQKNPSAWEGRALAHYAQREWQPARRDFLSLCDLIGDSQEYPRFYIWVLGMKLGEREQSINAELTAFLDKRNSGRPRDWVARIGEFLLDKTAEAAFIASAASPDAKTQRGQQCEAYYFAGVKRLLKNDRAGAAEMFTRCVDTKETDFIEYQLAQAELKLMGR